jgi:16S rRNA (cytidine1402-2'-O)-methyltransferase
MLDSLLRFLQPNTLLTIATDLTLPTELVKTLPVKNWKKQKIDLHKRPTVFIFQA